MTTVTAPVPFSFRAVKRTVVHDPSVTKVALYCATVVIVTAFGIIGWVASTAGDVGAISLAIGGFLTAAVTALSKLLNRKPASEDIGG